MEREISYDEFLQVIDDCYAHGFQLCLKSEDFGHDNWPVGRFIDYLRGIEFNKKESGIVTDYKSISSFPERVSRIEVSLLFPQTETAQAKHHHISWVVKPNRH